MLCLFCGQSYRGSVRRQRRGLPNAYVDNKTRLLYEDDIAHINLGEKWRLPTKTEWDELRNSCTWRKTTHNLVNGYLITGENGNSIFLPAAGRKVDNESLYVGDILHYQSSSLLVDTPEYAWGLYISSSNDWLVGLWRYSGIPIRPVFGDPQADQPDEPVGQDAISITISNITQTQFSVSFSTKSSDTYYTCALLKSEWDEIDDATKVCDNYINEDLNNGVLNQYLYSGNQSDTYIELDSKTTYVVFAAFCDSHGKRSGQVYYTFVTTK